MAGQGKRVTIYINNTDQWHHQPLYLAILELLRREGCAGATVMQGVAGFGGRRHIYFAGLADPVMDASVVVTSIDRSHRAGPALSPGAVMVDVWGMTVRHI